VVLEVVATYLAVMAALEVAAAAVLKTHRLLLVLEHLVKDFLAVFLMPITEAVGAAREVLVQTQMAFL
jgi:hypothetical protein